MSVGESVAEEVVDVVDVVVSEAADGEDAWFCSRLATKFSMLTKARALATEGLSGAWSGMPKRLRDFFSAS